MRKPREGGAFALMGRTVDICPGCDAVLPPRVCHFYFSTWTCWGCGGVIDGRVASPKMGAKCAREWPDYQPRFFEPLHPENCECGGRSWRPIEEVEA